MALVHKTLEFTPSFVRLPDITNAIVYANAKRRRPPRQEVITRSPELLCNHITAREADQFKVEERTHMMTETRDEFQKVLCGC